MTGIFSQSSSQYRIDSIPESQEERITTLVFSLKDVSINEFCANASLSLSLSLFLSLLNGQSIESDREADACMESLEYLLLLILSSTTTQRNEGGTLM